MAQDDSAARAAIDATNRKFEAAFNAGDPGRAAREVYTENASILPPDLPMVQGRENIAQFWVGAAAQLAVTEVRLSTVGLEVHGDVAHEIGKATLTLASGQQLAAKYCVFWAQDGGEWRWHADIWNAGV
jgi:ketosteroid isomerase-like protein